jgi:hypothetical protein
VGLENLPVKNLLFDIWFWWHFNKRSAVFSRVLTLAAVAAAIFSCMLVCYHSGRESGVVDGMTAGFDVGYKMKKPPIIIVAPKKDNYAPMLRADPADSVLFRI